MTRQLLLLLIAISLFSCKNDPSTASSASADKQEAAGKKYPTLPADRYSALFREITNIDFIAYTTNLSMSFDQANSVRTILQYISKDPTTLPEHCKPTTRVTFISDGTIALEADVYAYDGCSAFVFYENGVQAYANRIDPLGVEFFQRYIPEKGPEQVPAEQQ